LLYLGGPHKYSWGGPRSRPGPPVGQPCLSILKGEVKQAIVDCKNI